MTTPLNQASGPRSQLISIPALVGWLAVVFVSFLVVLFLVAGPYYLGHKIHPHEVMDNDIIAANKVMIVDEKKTQAAKAQAAHSVHPIYVRDKQLSETIAVAVEQSLALVESLRSKAKLPVAELEFLPAAEQVRIFTFSSEQFAAFQKVLEPGASGARDLFFDITGSGRAENTETAEQQAKRILFATVNGGKNAAAKRKELSGRLAFVHDAFSSFKLTGDVEKDRLISLLAVGIPADLTSWRKDSFAATRRLLSGVGLHINGSRPEWCLLIYEFLPDSWTATLRKQTSELIAMSFQPNMILDRRATDMAANLAAEQVNPILKEIELGSVVVRKGETVTPEKIEELKALGITEVRNLNQALAAALAVFAAYCLLGIFLVSYERRLFYAPLSLALIATISTGTLLVASIIGDQFPQFIPLAAATLLISIIYGKRLAFVLTLLLIVFFRLGEMVDGPYLIALGTAAGMALGASIQKRQQLMMTALLIGFLQASGFFIASILSATPLGAVPAEEFNFGRELPLQMIGGICSTIVAIGILPFFENIFGILTPYRLAELVEPDQILIRQLEENAPGTYQHSLAVANLAEGGARAIGADVALVRAGAMYHDIGKMVTPKYFIENQLGDKNPHDFIAPEESRARVLAHVTNGLALANKYGLPKAIRAFIPEHQGSTVMAYFYHKACMRDGLENVNINDFRYPGPKPQTKESAIVMLADVSEAVTHSMKDPSQEEVEATLDSVFKARWEDGQFAESGLSYEELDKIKKGFARVWRTLHHDRLKYPSTTTGRMPVPLTQPEDKDAFVQMEKARMTTKTVENEGQPGQGALPGPPHFSCGCEEELADTLSDEPD